MQSNQSVLEIRLMEKCKVATGSSTKDNQELADEEASVQLSLGKIKNKFLVMSGKGGVGKSSVSVNLSIALANKGYQVGIMDVDIHGPDVPRMLGVQGNISTDADKKLIPIRYTKNLSIISIESLMPGKDDAIIWRGPMKHAAIKQFIGDVNWGVLDYLIIDSPPGTGDEPLSVAQTISDAKAIIVTTPQEISLADVRKSINFCRIVKMNIFGIIENMSGFVCPHCSQEINLFGIGGGEKTALATNVPFLGRIPFDLNMVTCGDAGISFQEKYKDTEVSKSYANIAKKIIVKQILH
jgi:ATP-binding protein involved in chromosome partitioning